VGKKPLNLFKNKNYKKYCNNRNTVNYKKHDGSRKRQLKS